MMKFAVLILTICLSVDVFATPGIDTATAIKQYYVLLKQLRELKKQVSQANQMIRQGKDIVKNTEGHYGFGNLLNRMSDQKERDWADADWNSALQELSGGNSTRYAQLLKQYQKSHPILSERQFSKGASAALVRSYQNDVAVNKLATVQATEEYNRVKKLISNVNHLSQKIESAPNEKAAMDLNSRLLTELSYISAEELRMQTLINHQMAESSADELDAKTREAIFNQLPEEKKK